MPTYRIEAVLSRTYGTAYVEADNGQVAREMAGDPGTNWSQGEDSKLDVLEVEEIDPSDVPADEATDPTTRNGHTTPDSTLDTIEAFVRDMENASLDEFVSDEHKADISRAFRLLRNVADECSLGAGDDDPTT
jgi:hypothetical protein